MEEYDVEKENRDGRPCLEERDAGSQQEENDVERKDGCG